MRAVTVLLFALGVAGCAATPNGINGIDEDYAGSPATSGTRIEIPPSPLECVPYARIRSGVQLFGDASTWWAKAEGRYRRSRTPVRGSVLVLTGYAGPERGHLAVVRSVVSAREIRLDHANWLGDGAIYLDDPATDVSAENDWTEVRVWNARTGAWGIRTYRVEGFVGPERLAGSQRVATK